MQTLAPGMLVAEAFGDEPQRCDEVGCPCVVPKKLLDYRQGRTLVFVCPSSRICGTLSPASPMLVIGHYSGALR